ncbi:peptidoglycan -binding protein [Xanthobacter autotrophicus]|uniref:peptidoglycan -binding protein n=1 Tax=Xanthobacter autotrophicus TaxID=280 RepID=UPI001E4B2E54|nr:peptidoglycan -binding protein [Xanthobacter autotrophicus]UDQ90396.1 peptidoglycan -binding protein [Xanthobacter autotrophicus]
MKLETATANAAPPELAEAAEAEETARQARRLRRLDVMAALVALAGSGAFLANVLVLQTSPPGAPLPMARPAGAGKINHTTVPLTSTGTGTATTSAPAGGATTGSLGYLSIRTSVTGTAAPLVPAPSDTGRANALSRELDLQKDVAARAAAQIELLNQQIAALRRQMAALEEALNISEKRDAESQSKITDLGRRLNVALAQRVQELTRFRSEFFGRLRDILGNRPDIRVVGDRFVFQSEVFFDAGSAVMKPEAIASLDKLAGAILDLEKSIPPDISWALRIDGHTDNRPISTAQFPSNWELSAARAIAVVQYLIAKGVSPSHLIAAGFGEYQPLDTGTSDEARARNRRIELKLTER